MWLMGQVIVKNKSLKNFANDWQLANSWPTVDQQFANSW